MDELDKNKILVLVFFVDEGDESWGVLSYSGDEINGIVNLGIGG